MVHPTALLPLLHQPRRRQFSVRIATLLPAHHDRVPSIRRKADAKAPQALLAQPPPEQILASLLRLIRLPQILRVISRGPVEHLPQPRPSLALLLDPRILLLPLHLHPEPLGERLDRLAERKPLLLLEEREHIPLLAAAEAVIELLLRIHRERRRALIMEGAQPLEPLPRPLQLRIRRQHLRDIHGVAHLLDRLRRKARHYSLDSSGSASRRNAAMQNRSVIPAM